MLNYSFQLTDEFEILLPINYILMYYAIYFNIKILYSNYKRASDISAYITSTIACYMFLITGNYTNLYGYYWYDLIGSIMDKDQLMIFHHIYTMYVLSHTNVNIDFDNIRTLTYIIKISDMFIHYYKINVFINPELKERQLIFINISTVMYIIFRVLFPIMFLPLNSIEGNVLTLIIITASIYWITNLFRIRKRLINEINNKKIVNKK